MLHVTVRYSFVHNKVTVFVVHTERDYIVYGGADKSLARPGRKQAAAAEHFDVHIYYLYS